MRRSLPIALLLLLVLAATPGFAAQSRTAAARPRATAGTSLSVVGLWGRLLVTLGLDTVKPTGTAATTTPPPPPAPVGGGMDPDGAH